MKWLKELRVSLGPWPGKALPLREFARRLGYADPSTVKRAELKGRVSADLWRRLHERLGIPLHQLPKPTERPQGGSKKAPSRPQGKRSAAGTTPVGPSPASVSEPVAGSLRESLAYVIARRVALAVEQALARDQDAGRKGLLAVARELRKFAIGLQDGAGVDATDIFKVCQAIEESVERGELP